MTDVYTLPPDLPVPEDDGAADHLVGMMLPNLTLESSAGPVSLRELGLDRLVLYVYPRTGRPGEPSPPGWDAIPGARGIYAGRLRNAGQVEALAANLIAINRRYKAHAGVAITGVS